MIDVRRIHQLLAQAPQPPGEALPGGISDSECDAFEQRTGIRLPDEVRQWLKVSNGPCVGPGGLYGIRPQRSHLDIETFLEMFPSWRTRKWIPVAGDGCGNYYVIPTQAEYGSGYPVLFVDTNSTSDTPSFIVASNIGHFLVSLLEKELGREGWPFNESYVTKADPEITRFVGVSLPWTAE
jgi:cell wall assembly regulator SMI1